MLAEPLIEGNRRTAQTVTKPKAEVLAFTVCNLAYLPKVLVLAESVLRHTQTRLNIILIDRKTSLGLPEKQADFHWIEDFGVPSFEQLAFKYDITELSTAVKPFVTLKLLEHSERVLFLDPDTCLYHPLDPILKELGEHSIILTPHYTTPLNDHSHPGWANDLGLMRFGSFNLGFYAVRDSSTTRQFLHWWSDRCFQFNFMETQFGLSTDQKWVSIAPCFFKDMVVTFNLGCNVAPWNLFERSLTQAQNGNYIVNNVFPLIFFHFSNFDPEDPEYVMKRSFHKNVKEQIAIAALGNNYKKALAETREKLTRQNFPQSPKYGFGYMSGGQYISLTLRRAYACVIDELPKDHDPFDSEGVVGDFAQRNHLFERENYSYKAHGFKDIAQHRYKIKFIYFLMRLFLRFAGPNRLYDLSRLLVYLSSYRQNRGLWKYQPSQKAKK